MADNTYRPSIGIGTIFARGKRRTYCFEHKTEKIKASLGTTDPLEAEKEARRRFGYLLAGDRVEQLQEATARLAMAEDDERDARRTSIPLNVEAVWKAYERQLSLVSVSRRHADGSRTKPLSPRHLRQQKSSLAKFLTWYAINGKGKHMHQVRSAEARDFFADLLADGCRFSSYNRYRADLSVIWARLAEKISCESPFLAVPVRKAGEVAEDTTHKRLFTTDELATIHERATGWIAVAAVVGEETGLRFGDVVTLETSEIDGDHLVMQTRKGRKNQVLYAPLATAKIREWLGTTPDVSGFVFPEQAKRYLGLGGFKRNDSAAVKEFMEFLRNTCKIRTKDDKGQTVAGFHSLRVTAATRAATSGQDAQRLLGHSDQRTTEGYVQPTLEQAKAMAKKASQTALERVKTALLALNQNDQEEFGSWYRDEIQNQT